MRIINPNQQSAQLYDCCEIRFRSAGRGLQDKMPQLPQLVDPQLEQGLANPLRSPRSKVLVAFAAAEALAYVSQAVPWSISKRRIFPVSASIILFNLFLHCIPAGRLPKSEGNPYEAVRPLTPLGGHPYHAVHLRAPQKPVPREQTATRLRRRGVVRLLEPVLTGACPSQRSFRRLPLDCDGQNLRPYRGCALAPQVRCLRPSIGPLGCKAEEGVNSAVPAPALSLDDQGDEVQPLIGTLRLGREVVAFFCEYDSRKRSTEYSPGSVFDV